MGLGGWVGGWVWWVGGGGWVGGLRVGVGGWGGTQRGRGGGRGGWGCVLVGGGGNQRGEGGGRGRRAWEGSAPRGAIPARGRGGRVVTVRVRHGRWGAGFAAAQHRCALYLKPHAQPHRTHSKRGTYCTCMFITACVER